MLIYAKKVEITDEDTNETTSELKLYGTTANVPSDDDVALTYQIDGAETELDWEDTYVTWSEDGQAYIKRLGNDESIAVYLGDTLIAGVPTDSTVEEEGSAEEESSSTGTGADTENTDGTDTTGSETAETDEGTETAGSDADGTTNEETAE